jgi:hypothetical protein
MEEENKIKEAEIIDDEKKEARLKRGIDFRLELALFLILGFLLGVVVKTEAVKRITIGFNDSSIPSQRQAYDFEKIKEEIAEQNAAAEQAAPAPDANN